MLTRLVKATRIDFVGLRRELELPTQFSLAAQREADEAAARVIAMLPRQTTRAGANRAGANRIDGAVSTEHTDRTDLPFVTIDPASSRDLDQALCLRRRGAGYRVHYAIADVTAFVPRGGEIEAETFRRGQTVYLPDGKVPLHPAVLSEGAGSLLPGQPRLAALWTIDLDADAAMTSVRVERAVVRSRAKLDYLGVQAAADAGTLADAIALLPTIGRLLTARGLARGAINLPIPEQEVEPDDGGWRLVLRAPVPAEAWNAQISLLTGMAAATLMLDGGIGLLRTMPAPRAEAVSALRLAAGGLGVRWPDGASVGQVIDAVDPVSPRGAAFVDHAAELMRGAGYTPFDGSVPPVTIHGAVAASYAHVTAPLRRLADRYAAEVCLSLAAGVEVPQWVRAALPLLPDIMRTSDRRASAAERGAVDLTEAVLLAGRVGEEFDAAVLDVDQPRKPRNNGPTSDVTVGAGRPPGGVIAIDEPPVRARCQGVLPLGERIRVRLVTADPQRRSVAFEAV